MGNFILVYSDGLVRVVTMLQLRHSSRHPDIGERPIEVDLSLLNKHAYTSDKTKGWLLNAVYKSALMCRHPRLGKEPKIPEWIKEFADG